MTFDVSSFRSEAAHILPINIWSSCTGSLFFPDPRNDVSTANWQLLKFFDSSSSCGKVSFIPIGFLRDKIGRVDTYFGNEIDEKKFLLEELKKKKYIDETYLSSETFKGVPLVCFRKILCRSDYSYCGDSLVVKRTRLGPTWEELGVNIESIQKNEKKLKHNSKSEWMYLDQISKYVTNMSKMAKGNPVTILPSYYSGISISSIVPETKTRFYMGIILHRSHFTSYFIDTECHGKNVSKKNIYFFDSCGFSPHDFNTNPSYRFVGHDMAYDKSRTGKTSSERLFFDHIFNHFQGIFGLSYAFFNTFKIQHLNAECGMFASTFLLQIVHQLTHNTDKWDTRLGIHGYYTMANIGNDLMMSWIKASHFITKEDLNNASISENEYMHSVDIYPVTNKRFVQFRNIYSRWAKQFNALCN